MVPADVPYVYHKLIFFMLVRPIPRVLWPEKPVDPGINLNEEVGERGVSLSCSVIGEFYLSAGWTGIFLGGLLYGKLAKSISGFLMRQPGSSAGLVYGLSVMALFAGLRSMIELILMNYALLAWAGVSWLFLRYSRARKEKAAMRQKQRQGMLLWQRK
jgi:hypothetical protein